MGGPPAAATFDRVEDDLAVFVVYDAGARVATLERPVDEVPENWSTGDRFLVHADDPADATVDDLEFDPEKTERFGDG